MIQENGPFLLDAVTLGDCRELIAKLRDESVDILITSPPYWGQRISHGHGVEEDPRDYIQGLADVFKSFLPKLKPSGLVWINIGDAYNTPVNWRQNDRKYSTLGSDKNGLSHKTSAYVKPRAKRRAFIDATVPWLRYGNLLALPDRLVIALCDLGYLFRGQVVWSKRNPCPRAAVADHTATTSPSSCSLRPRITSSESLHPSPRYGNFQTKKSMAEPIIRDFPKNCLAAASTRMARQTLMFLYWTHSRVLARRVLLH